MDIFFTDPSETPLPPGEVRIRKLQADPWPDGRRVKIYLEVDPFQRRPSADLTITDRDGREVAGASVIESMNRKMEMNLHLRDAEPGEFTLQVVVFYAAVQEPNEAAEAGGSIERTIVDTASVTFQAGSA
jgi:hypothetical protein